MYTMFKNRLHILERTIVEQFCWTMAPPISSSRISTGPSHCSDSGEVCDCSVFDVSDV